MRVALVVAGFFCLLGSSQGFAASVGIYFDRDGLVTETGVEIGWYQPDGSTRVPVFLIGRDLEGGAREFDFAITSFHADILLSDEVFPGADSWLHWASTGVEPGVESQSNYTVRLADCTPSEGQVVLAEFFVTFRYDWFTRDIRLVPVNDETWGYPELGGYRRCDSEELERTDWEFSDRSIFVYLPDPIEEDTWSRVKSLYR